ncbi:MAG: hypothetical protein ACREBC_35000, partial [Pyrinomonadaceae bacterium]
MMASDREDRWLDLLPPDRGVSADLVAVGARDSQVCDPSLRSADADNIPGNERAGFRDPVVSKLVDALLLIRFVLAGPLGEQ